MDLAGDKNCTGRIIIIFLLVQKCFARHLLQREGIADEFLAGIMCSRTSSSACCLYKYSDPQSRGHVGQEEKHKLFKHCFAGVLQKVYVGHVD